MHLPYGLLDAGTENFHYFIGYSPGRNLPPFLLLFRVPSADYTLLAMIFQIMHYPFLIALF